MAYTYILYSIQLDKYYIGHTESTPEDRLKKHLSDHDGYTGQVKDWRIVWRKYYETKSEAYAMERKIKSWKSRKAVLQLISGT